MKKLLKILALILTIIFLNGKLAAIHSTHWNNLYNKCQTKLIKADNYNNDEQVYKCLYKDTLIKVLGTLLSKEGSL